MVQITILEAIDAEWLQGSLDGKTGMFPRAFVHITDEMSVDGSATADSCVTPAPDGVAAHEVTPATDEVTPDTDEVTPDTDKVTPATDGAVATADDSGCRMIATADFDAEQDGDLGLRVGDVVSGI